MLRLPLGVLRTRAVATPARCYGVRYASHAPSTKSPLSRTVLKWTLAGTGLGIGLTATGLGVALYNESNLKAIAEREGTRPPTPLRDLLRTYVVYGLCSFPTLVDWSPTILSTLLSIPLVDKITEAVVRVTFFDQFVGADTADDCIPLLHKLRAENKGCLFAYSVEVDENEAATSRSAINLDASDLHLPPHKRAVQEMLESIDVAANFEDGLGEGHGDALSRKTWVAIKLTALVPDARTLVHLSQDLVAAHASHKTGIPFPDAPRPEDLDVLRDSVSQGSALTPADIHALRELRDDLFAICEKAEKRRVKIIIDAEYSWYQPAVDAYVLALMLRFNRLSGIHTDNTPVQPLIYQTYQAYLRRTPAYLRQSLAFAKSHGFALGAKLVRGAYHPHEMAAHVARGGNSSPSISDDELPPVWASKDETDRSYNECVGVIIDAIAADVVASSSSAGGAGWISRLFGSTPSSTGKGEGRPPAVGVLFGTHNRASCGLLLSSLSSRGLASPSPGHPGSLTIPPAVAGRVALAQLYGMHDALTNALVDGIRSEGGGPVVLKYVPYGGLKEVMPYLSRRAIENKSVLFDGAAAAERQAAGREIWNRIFG